VRLGNQRGQALPTVLAIMLLLVLLAGGATLAVSAVLRQQNANRGLTNADLASQNAVAATAATLASSAGPACATSPSILFTDNFQKPIGTRWSFPSGSWAVQHQVLTALGTGTSTDVATPNVKGASQWSNYAVSVDLKPKSNAPGTWIGLDAYLQNNSTRGFSPTAYYWLQIRDGDKWTLGRTLNSTHSRTLMSSQVSYDTSHPTKLELDLFGGEITAKINDGVVARLQDSPPAAIGSGSVAIEARGSQVEVADVTVDQIIPVPTQVSLSPVPPVSSGIPSGFYCQRIDNISTAADAVSQQRVAVPNVSSCSKLDATIMVPAGSGHVKIWFTLPVAASRFTVALGGCPNDTGTADCGRQRSTAPGWKPALTVVGADCANTDPTTKVATTYPVFLSTSYRGSLPPIAIRSAPDGAGSVYMTVIAARAASGQPYEESDILKPQNVLSYEGVL
jgi:hypothetical protein